MSGINSILTEIENQGKLNAEEIITASKKEAEKIRSDGNLKAEQTYSSFMSKYRSDIEREYASGCSGAQTSAKRKILACKVECIDSVIKETELKLHELPDDEYFGLIVKLAAKRLRKGKGIFSFCSYDLERMPDDFEKTLQILAQPFESSVEISREPVNIADGFILSYGDISENCSFNAIIEAEREAVRDLAASILFQ